jgi:Glycosyl transferase family 2
MIPISYAITAHNEHVELERLLDQLNKHINPNDEIVLQLDNTATEEVRKVAEKYNVGSRYEYHRIYFGLNGDFSSFKNNLKKHCTRPWMFQIDADEYLSPWLLNNLHSILQNNPTTDLFLIPRINTVEGLTQDHINKWRWNVNESGWINFPDYQTRILQNSPKIWWVNKVHEVLTGHKSYALLPTNEEYCLIHPKTISRQEIQNQYYDTLQQLK